MGKKTLASEFRMQCRRKRVTTVYCNGIGDIRGVAEGRGEFGKIGSDCMMDYIREKGEHYL